VTIPDAKSGTAPRAQALALLALLTLAWGVNWPVMKIGASMLPPLWFRSLGLAIGTLLLGLVLLARGRSLRVSRRDLFTIAWLAVPNVIVWYAVVTVAVTMLPAGRAAILGFTMPVWSALIGAVFYREPLDRRTVVGVACAIAGIALLLGADWSALSGRPLGVLLMLVAAVAWAWGTHLFRRVELAIETTVVTFWMMLVGCPVLFAASALGEAAGWRVPRGVEWWPILYNGFVVLAIGNLIWFSIARSVAPTIAGLSALAIPVVGVFAGMAVLGETPTWRDFGALILIGAAVAIGLLPKRRG
jgi:drug/metabolite transporter (DMT)-like permease